MLRIAGFSYMWRTAALENGTADLGGREYDYVTLDPVALGTRLYVNHEFDIGEMWGASYISDVAAGKNEYVAVPIFPSRSFRHSFIFIREDAGINVPGDLAGKKVGVVEYIQTAAVWIRAFLKHDYGVDPADVEWSLSRQKTHAIVLPPADVSWRFLDEGVSVEDALRAGAVDAVIGPVQPGKVLAIPGVRRLFPTDGKIERDYFFRTGIFPIMHFVGIRRDIYEADCGLAADLVEAFESSKRWGYERAAQTSAVSPPLPYMDYYLEEVTAAFGLDPFPNGIEDNEATLDALTSYVWEQGMSVRKVSVPELFASR